jgi:Mg2+ and Co2+ transporter CorA
LEDGHAPLEEKRVENNTPLLERLERVIDTLSDNSIKMGQMLAVHDEKLDKQDRIDAVLFEKIESVHREINRSTKEIKTGCERDIRLVDNRLRVMEKKMWSIFGALSIISFVVSPIGQRIVGAALTPNPPSTIIQGTK